MRVRYQIVAEITADGMLGPLRVIELFQHALNHHLTMELELGKVRVAAVYPLAPPDQEPMALGSPFGDPRREASGTATERKVDRVPGTDQSRAVEEVKDQKDRI